MFITSVEVITNFKKDFMNELSSMLRRVHDEQQGLHPHVDAAD
jgi:hypothetical protein